MYKKLAFAAAAVALLASPLLVSANTIVDPVSALQGNITNCLTPPQGTSATQIQQACASLLQSLLTIVLQLTQQTNPTTPQTCPVYQQPMCPAGQHMVSDPSTFDANKCEIPHFHCVSDPSTPPTSSLSASPTSGLAPLAVNFSYALGDSTPDNYSITFGDGSSAVPTVGCGLNPNFGSLACPRSLVASHTYSAGGTYTATLVYSLCGKAQGGVPQCAAPDKIVGTVTITVVTSAKPTCPIQTSVDCAPGFHQVGQGQDSNGCWLANRCVPNGICPVTIVDCATGYHPMPQGYDANGCQRANTCAPNALSCIFNPIGGVASATSTPTPDGCVSWCASLNNGTASQGGGMMWYGNAKYVCSYGGVQVYPYPTTLPSTPDTNIYGKNPAGASASDSMSNLANALTALEATLQGLLTSLSH